MKNRNVEAAESYINGLKLKDLSSLPLAPDVVFEGPLSPDKLHGAKSVIEFLSGILPIIKDVRIRQTIADGEHVCVLWELETSTPAAIIPICEYFRVSDSLIREVRPYYDPRPLFPTSDL
jgi:hypothetical protein